MDLSDALDFPSGNNQSQGNSAWPGQPNHQGWPGQPTNPTPPLWPGGNSGGGGGGMWSTDPSAQRWPGAGPAAFPSEPQWPGIGPTPGPAPSPSGPGWQGPGPTPGPASSPSGPGWQGPGPTPGPAPSPSGPGWQGPGPTQNLSIPYTQKLPGGVEKVSITIAGTIKHNPDKITVDLSTSRDLAFHFNPRFNESGRQVIVRNSCIGGQWGAEERELRHFPFCPGKPFELKIDCTNQEFRVAVNNAHLLTYRHRIPDLRSINTLRIYNDLSLSKVDVKSH